MYVYIDIIDNCYNCNSISMHILLYWNIGKCKEKKAQQSHKYIKQWQTMATWGKRHTQLSKLDKTPQAWVTLALIYTSVSLTQNLCLCLVTHLNTHWNSPIAVAGTFNGTTHAINEPRIRALRWNRRDHLHWATSLLIPVPGVSTWLFLFMFIRPFTYFFFLIIGRDNLWKWLLLVLFNVCTVTINNPSSEGFWTKGH